MKSFNIVIVGGGPAGVTAAISARNTYPGKSIALIRKEQVPMIPCGIPYILHSLESIDQNILPDAPLHNKNVEIIIDEVVGRNDHVLELASGEKIQYEKLVLATGSKVFIPPIEGIDLEGVFYVKKEKTYLETFKENALKAQKIVIIGGGATGIGAAIEAASRGYKVALFEMGDFGQGTSSRSTKLIHGGVRYLQHGNVSLVLEALKERGLLLQNAPHLVHNLPFIVPVYDWWVANILNAFSRFSVPMFVMISGCVLLGRNYETQNFYIKRGIRLLPALLFWSLFYIAFDYVFNDKELSSILWKLKIGIFISGKAYFHLWYLSMLICLMLFAPFINNYIIGKKPIFVSLKSFNRVSL